MITWLKNTVGGYVVAVWFSDNGEPPKWIQLYHFGYNLAEAEKFRDHVKKCSNVQIKRLIKKNNAEIKKIIFHNEKTNKR